MIADNEQTIAMYLSWFSASRSRASTSSYKYALYPFRKWLEYKELRIVDVSFDDIVHYAEHLRSGNLKDNTRAIYHTALKSLYRWLYDQGKVSWNPELIPTVQIEYDMGNRVAATPEEISAILGTFDENFPDELRTKAAIALLADSGLRLGELLSLDESSIDVTLMKGRVKTYKRRGHWREFYWEEPTNELLKQWLYVRNIILQRDSIEQTALFISLATNSICGRLDRHVIQKAMRDACKKLGITRRISPHPLRHGYITERMKRGMNLRALQKSAGHAKITTTQLYMHLDEDEVEKEYRRTSSLKARSYEEETV